MSNLIIAIDGHSSTGKSTLAKLLAKKLGYTHIDSGAMYRAITLYALKNHLIQEDEIQVETLLEQLDSIDIYFKFNSEQRKNEIFLNGKNVEEEIRDMYVSSKVSLIAKIPEIRDFAVKLQRKMAKKGGIVMDGRDIGTVVFPDADVKIFLTASAEKRALRRYEELLQTEHSVSYEEVVQNITERDFLDTTREAAPLRQAEDAVLVDNGSFSPKETLEKVLKIIQEKTENNF
ncbi:MAG: (d)CMP kinase [Weeksellaceae bacterium]|jgi:cytidylate kinase|nr:(d)CMP kinase [Weeksellaceae bacterium]MDX9704963.1 (d)CMP kinase [Weeksellaceae bacterium]